MGTLLGGVGAVMAKTIIQSSFLVPRYLPEGRFSEY